MKKSRRTYNGVHLNKKSNTQDVVEQSLTLNEPSPRQFDGRGLFGKMRTKMNLIRICERMNSRPKQRILKESIYV